MSLWPNEGREVATAKWFILGERALKTPSDGDHAQRVPGMPAPTSYRELFWHSLLQVLQACNTMPWQTPHEGMQCNFQHAVRGCCSAAHCLQYTAFDNFNWPLLYGTSNRATIWSRTCE